jgi:hypothetical protein
MAKVELNKIVKVYSAHLRGTFGRRNYEWKNEDNNEHKQALNSHATIHCGVKILKLVRSQSYHAFWMNKQSVLRLQCLLYTPENN